MQLHDETDEVDQYLNAALKEAFTKNWTLAPVEFYSKKEILEKLKWRIAAYAYLLPYRLLAAS